MVVTTQADKLTDNSQKTSTQLQSLHIAPETTHITFPKLRERSQGWSHIKWGIVLAVSGLFAYRFYQELFIIDPVVGVYSLLVSFLILTSFAVGLLRYKDPSSTLRKTEGPLRNYHPKVSIIIPARNEPIIIKKTVSACLSSSYSNIEIILVNDGSTDETGVVMDSLHKENPEQVKVIHLSSNMGKRKAIQEALTQSNIDGELIVLHDSDSIVQNSAIERIVTVFRDPDVGAATCYSRPLNADNNLLTKMQDTWYDGSFYILKAMESSFGSVTCCSGVLSAYRREAIVPCLDAWVNDRFLGVEFRPGDDRQLTSYIIGGSKYYLGKQNKVWKTYYCESAVVLTEAPSSFKKFINQQIRWKKSWIRVFLFTAPFYFRYRSPIAVAFYYIQMLLSVVAPAVAIRNLIIMPLMGDYLAAIAYFLGVFAIGLLFAVLFKVHNPGSGHRWVYRLLVSLLSLFVLSPLLYYAIFRIREGKSWQTR
jgi:cellulose synthase/poly-beta-1,6-N-acetylglucosamine synthase-like glycosyltransferase